MRQNKICLSYSFGSWLMRERCAGSCRIALMSVANEKGVVVDPTPLSKWAHVESNAVKVAEEYVGRRLPQGGFSLISGSAELISPLIWDGG